MIYTDGIHLITDGPIDELHKFAQSIGLKREWYQGPPKTKWAHYDTITQGKKNKALKAGAIKVSSKEIVTLLKKQD